MNWADENSYMDDDMRRLIFAKRRWYHYPENIALAVAVAGIALAIGLAWLRVEAQEPQECVQVYRQGNITNQATGRLWTDGSGRVVCEVSRG